MATPQTVNIRISTLSSPECELVPAGGFYQLEEDTLYVQVGRFETGERFFSSLESEHVRLECDHSGRLIFIELTIPRRRWREQNDFALPEKTTTADVRFLDFRSTISEPEIYCNMSKNSICLRFSDNTTESIKMGEHLVFDIGSDNTLAGIWISGIVDDMAGREISAFRRTLSKPRAKE